MTAPAPYRSSLRGEARDGFGRLLLAEWTKLTSVPRWALTLAAAAMLTVLIALLAASGSRTAGDGAGGGPPPDLQRAGVVDQGHLTYRPMAGDGAVVARVTAQRAAGDWAKAGLIIRRDAERGSPYAALVVTPRHGVRLQTDYQGRGGVAGTGARPGDGAVPRWLRLTRAGTTVTGEESADGRAWHRVGAVRVTGLRDTADVGLVVATPDDIKITRGFGGEAVAGRPAATSAVFDNVTVAPVRAQAGTPWRDRGGLPGPGGPRDYVDGSTRAGGVFTLSGAGDLGTDQFAPDTTGMLLTGALIGQVAIVAVAALFITSEYRRGTIAATLAATPRRGRVLAAKAVVAGLAGLAAGLAAGFGSLLAAGPVLRSHGIAPPPLSDSAVLRAAAGTGALLAAVAVFSLALATLLRRSAPAITVALLALLVPQIVAPGLPVSAARWLERLTPAAGFAIQQTARRYDTAIGPWAGLGVLCAYAAAALAAAAWRLRRDT